MSVVYCGRDLHPPNTPPPLPNHRTSYGTNNLESGFELLSVPAPTTEMAVLNFLTFVLRWRTAMLASTRPIPVLCADAAPRAFMSVYKGPKLFLFHHKTRQFGSIGGGSRHGCQALDGWIASMPETYGVREERRYF